MRKSKYLIAGVAAVALSVAVSSTAQAATFQSQSLDMAVERPAGQEEGGTDQQPAD